MKFSYEAERGAAALLKLSRHENKRTALGLSSHWINIMRFGLGHN